MESQVGNLARIDLDNRKYDYLQSQSECMKLPLIT